MTESDYSYCPSESESSDTDDSDIDLRHVPKRQQDFKQSNLFFATLDEDDKDAIRNNQIYKRNHYEKGLTKDKRTTVQQVLDKRTYVRLRKLCGQGVFHYMYGTISTGKEANVFDAETQYLDTYENPECADYGDNYDQFVNNNSNICSETGSSISNALSPEASVKDLSEKLKETNINTADESVHVKDAHEEHKKQKYSRVAIKVYKTSILVFKDRSRYIEGEFRFRRAYVGTKNPRKMVAQWAEKEFRNLRRIVLSGIYCPAPIALRDHILVMDLILDGDEVAPKLENLGACPLIEWQTIYVQTVCIMRILFQECKLIHGDLSSFNMLYSKGRVNVIDTSQALENDHPNAMPFLKRDCENITRFFESVSILNQDQNEDVMPYDELKLITSEQLFCFIVARTLEGIDLDQQRSSIHRLPHAQAELWKDESLSNVKHFWEIEDSEIEYDAALCVGKMTRFNKFGTSKDIRGLIMKKRRVYLDLCRAVYDFLTASAYSSEEARKQISWLQKVNFDKQLPMNISQMPLDLAESAVEHTDNVIIAMNAIINDHLSDHEDDYDNVEEGANGMTNDIDDGKLNRQNIDAEDNGNSNMKFTGKIPDGVDPREWKKMVKEYNRERRKHKIPKHIKKKFGTSRS
ncbi:atypical RIO RIO1 kinase [Babesia ovis]|uniref:non-specific serine/threonine protein kinase n=1 Tax=Babesia ovis TaxID=5869 RepID=A0A9W5TCU8_BABOV|nr:atypical RIO RIO1 kinase [Babesia ovis]